MENLNHANLKETSSDKPLVAADWQLINTKINKSFLTSEKSQYQLVEYNQLADIQIKNNDNEFFIYTNLDNGRIFKCSIENFQFYFNKIISLYEKFHPTKMIENKNLAQFKKSKKYWPSNHKLFLSLNDFMQESHNIAEFTQKFYKLEQLEKFKTIHLFIHKKGAVSAKHIEIKNDRFSEALQGVKEFTTLFQAIKKSKNRSFGQSTLKAANFQILGTCIAHEFSLLNHNIILIFSKDDFLPQQEVDISFFNDYKQCFTSYFEILLNIEFNYEKCFSIFESLKELSHFPEILQNDFEQIKDNSNYRTLLNIDYPNLLQELKEKHFDLADINHQERMILLGELLNTLKHELSNPLFGLQLSSELLLQENLDEEQMEFIRHIHANISRSQSIIENFSGLYKDTPTIEEVNIETLIKEVFTLTKSESKQVLKTIKFDDPKVESIKTNPTYLAQILFNLIINSSQALKEAETKSPLINVSVQKTNDSIIFIISDNGPGIPKNDQNTIFDAFYTTKQTGTGLGLAISKRLAEKINGELTLLPSPSGAIFKLVVNL